MAERGGQNLHLDGEDYGSKPCENAGDSSQPSMHARQLVITITQNASDNVALRFNG